MKNLFDIYLPIVDDAFIFDNSDGSYELIAEKKYPNDLRLLDVERMNILKQI